MNSVSERIKAAQEAEKEAEEAGLKERAIRQKLLNATSKKCEEFLGLLSPHETLEELNEGVLASKGTVIGRTGIHRTLYHPETPCAVVRLYWLNDQGRFYWNLVDIAIYSVDGSKFDLAVYLEKLCYYGANQPIDDSDLIYGESLDHPRAGKIVKFDALKTEKMKAFVNREISNNWVSFFNAPEGLTHK